jgi:hypothetical protein
MYQLGSWAAPVNKQKLPKKKSKKSCTVSSMYQLGSWAAPVNKQKLPKKKSKAAKQKKPVFSNTTFDSIYVLLQ